MHTENFIPVETRNLVTRRGRYSTGDVQAMPIASVQELWHKRRRSGRTTLCIPKIRFDEMVDLQERIG